jgi:hypothetical protein
MPEAEMNLPDDWPRIQCWRRLAAKMGNHDRLKAAPLSNLTITPASLRKST